MSNKSEKETKKWTAGLLLVWMTFMPLSFSGGIVYSIVTYLPIVENFNWIQWVLVYTGTVATMGFALTPTTVIALVSGYFLGFLGMFPVVITYSLASIIGFGLSNTLSNSFQGVIAQSYPKLDHFLSKISSKSPYQFVIFSRISPILPFAVMNLVLPFVGIKFKPFFWGGMVGMMPRTLLAVAAGKLTNDIINIIKHPAQGSLMQTGFAMLLLVSVFGFLYLYKRISNQN